MVKKKKVRLNKALFGFCLGIALTHTGYAAEPVETRDVIVTATRTEQEVKETPAAVTVITAEELKSKGAVTLRNALEAQTGISFTEDGMMRSTVSIRGMESRHTLILIDGRRMTGETGNSSANAYDLDRIRMENVERIEIVRGPASALYGSDAMGGVINIITKKATKQQWLLDLEGAKYDHTSNGTNNWYLQYDTGKQGKFSWSLGGGERHEDPYTYANGTSGNYYGRRTPLDFKGVWQPSQKETVTFDYNHLKEELTRSQGTSKTLNHNTRNNYSIDYAVKGEKADYHFRVYQSVYDKDYESRATSNNALKSFDVVKRETNVVEGSVSQEWKQNHLLTYGGEYREDYIRGTRINSGKNSYVLTREGKTSSGSEASIKYHAAYIQDEWSLDDKWLVIPALRYDGSDSFESAWSPKLGVTYKIKNNSRLKANFAYGFKTPTPTELYHDWQMAPGWYFKGNPDLKPEKSKSYELAWEGENGPLFGKISYFHNKVTDLIDSYNTGVLQGTNYIYNYHNIGKATLKGFETEIGRKLSDQFDVKVNYTYLDAVNDTTGARLTKRPRHQIGLTLHYQNVSQGLNGTIWGTWSGSYLDESTAAITEKTFGIWNVLLNKELDKNTTVYVGVDNLFNYKDADRWINGSVYRTGLKLKF